MTNEELTAHTTFYALTAPGYTLEYQILGTLTLREWLKKNDGGQFAEDNLTEWLLEQPWVFTREEQANGYASGMCSVEVFTAAELLNRLRIEGMEQSDDH